MSEQPDESPPPPAPVGRIRPAAPSAPAPAPLEPPLIPQPAPGPEIVAEEDDDRVIVPAPDLSTFARSAPRPKRPRRVTPQASLALRRTLIPILLTIGVLLPALSVWALLVPDAPLNADGRWVPLTFLITGAICLLLAILNMLQVRHLLSQPPNP